MQCYMKHVCTRVLVIFVMDMFVLVSQRYYLILLR